LPGRPTQHSLHHRQDRLPSSPHGQVGQVGGEGDLLVAEDGDKDDLWPPSRGARYAFESQFHNLPQDDQDPYDAEKVSRIPGKKNSMNTIIIINRAVKDNTGYY
jgi:hypothetical protein